MRFPEQLSGFFPAVTCAANGAADMYGESIIFQK